MKLAVGASRGCGGAFAGSATTERLARRAPALRRNWKRGHQDATQSWSSPRALPGGERARSNRLPSTPPTKITRKRGNPGSHSKMRLTSDQLSESLRLVNDHRIASGYDIVMKGGGSTATPRRLSRRYRAALPVGDDQAETHREEQRNDEVVETAVVEAAVDPGAESDADEGRG